MKPTSKAREALETMISYAIMRYGWRKQTTGESGQPGYIVSRLKESSQLKCIKDLKSEDIAEVSPEVLGDDFDTTERKKISKILMEFDKNLKR